MIHKQKLFKGLEKISDGDEFIGCNLAQAEPNTVIFKDKRGLKFTDCNLARATVPKDSIIKDCNTSQALRVIQPDQPEMMMITKTEYDHLKTLETK